MSVLIPPMEGLGLRQKDLLMLFCLPLIESIYSACRSTINVIILVFAFFSMVMACQKLFGAA
jgi:hypothetical protein